MARARHGPRHGLAYEERALEIDAQHGIEIRLGHVQEVRRAEDARVVYQHVDAPMGRQHLGHERFHLRLVAHVAAHVERAELLRQRLAACVVHVHDHRLGAIGREAAHAGLADALGAAGDDADAALQAEVDGGCRDRCLGHGPDGSGLDGFF